MEGPLKGVRVLDFGRYVAGPYCATLLADFGADVIRVERPDGGEDRGLMPVTADGWGAVYLQTGRNKRAMTLDPAQPEGRKVLAALVATADIVVVNMAASGLAALGLDYETLRSFRDDIILVSLSAFGPDGPWADRIGFDSVGQCMSGAVYLTGTPEQPYRAQVNWVDFSTAAHAAFGAMVALRERDRTGRGQVVSGSLLATAIAVTNGSLIEQDKLSLNRQAVGNRSFTSAPTDIVRARDGWLMCHVVGQAQFRRWAKMVGRDDLTADPRFSDDQRRGENGAELSRIMAAWCADKLRDDVIEALASARIPGAPVLTPGEALRHPQVEALGIMHTVAAGSTGETAPLALSPIQLSRTPSALSSAAPALGANTAELLAELGYRDADIQRLRSTGII